jgi:hypothetical protein
VSNPTPLAARHALREQLLAEARERAMRDAVRAHSSIKCGEYGQHATAPGGCRNDGSTCLCACHDPAEETDR